MATYTQGNDEVGTRKRFGGEGDAGIELRVSLPSDAAEEEGRLLLAIKLYEVGKLSLGHAVKMAGLSRQTFLEMLGRYQVPVIAYPTEDLRQESQV